VTGRPSPQASKPRNRVAPTFPTAFSFACSVNLWETEFRRAARRADGESVIP
jgi:hypothetical protein